MKSAGLIQKNETAFRFSLGEFSGALADLGVLLPLVLALIRLNGIQPVSALVVIGLAYLLNAAAYRLPIPVQPLKSLSATALALGLSAGVINAGAWWMTGIFLVLAMTGAADWLGRLFPRPVVRGIQLGLGALLLRSAFNLFIPFEPWLLAGAGVILLVFLKFRVEWAALAMIGFGIAAALWQHGFPGLDISPSLPAPSLPALTDFGPAFWLLALPQIPLSLANSVYATTDTAQQYFGKQAGHVTPRRLLTTMGLANAAAALFGGVPVCHGCGGLTAHYRLGARTGGAPLMLGVLFLSLGILGGGFLLPLLELIPFAVLGVLLAYIGIQHGLLARDLNGWREWLPAAAVAATAWFTRNLAFGFLAGFILYYLLALLARGKQPHPYPDRPAPGQDHLPPGG